MLNIDSGDWRLRVNEEMRLVSSSSSLQSQLMKYIGTVDRNLLLLTLSLSLPRASSLGDSDRRIDNFNIYRYCLTP